MKKNKKIEKKEDWKEITKILKGLFFVIPIAAIIGFVISQTITEDLFATMMASISLCSASYLLIRLSSSLKNEKI